MGFEEAKERPHWESVLRDMYHPSWKARGCFCNRMAFMDKDQQMAADP